jgi:hypothetical protein
VRETKYTENNAGIRLETKDGIAVQCGGRQSIGVKDELDRNGFVVCTIRFMERTKAGKYRMPTFHK